MATTPSDKGKAKGKGKKGEKGGKKGDIKKGAKKGDKDRSTEVCKNFAAGKCTTPCPHGRNHGKQVNNGCLASRGGFDTSTLALYGGRFVTRNAVQFCSRLALHGAG